MNYGRILVAGVAATAAMTLFMLLVPLLHLPQTSVAMLLSHLTVHSMILGWILHFVIGIAFAFVYVILFNKWLPVENNVSRGAIYSLLMFIVSAAAMVSIGMVGDFTGTMLENISLSVFTSVIAYLIYGCVLGGFFHRKTYTPVHSIET